MGVLQLTEIHTLKLFSDGSVQVVVPPNTDQLALVKSDEKTYRWGFGVRPVAPDPAIFPVSASPEAWHQTDFCRFGKDWQWCQAELLSMQMYGKPYADLRVIQKQIIINVFLKLTQSDRAYNNYNGTDLKNCYVTLNGVPIIRGDGVNGEDAKWESLITAGNKVRILERKTALFGRNVGREFGRLQSFYSYEKPPVVTKELLNDPRVHYAKIINPAPPGGVPYLTNFHYGEWPVGLPMPVLFLTGGFRWYDMRELQLL